MIVVDRVSFRYDGAADRRPALDNVSLTIDEGAFVAVLGANGSGKSTLGRCLNGLVYPNSGRVVVDELDLSDVPKRWEVQRRVGMIFQNPDNQIVSTTVERELAFGLENIGLPTAGIRERVDRALDMFHLTPYRMTPPHQLSGGQKQRLAIAAVVAMRPRYLVCDEPTALLDPRGREEILSLIIRLRADHGMGIILITQFPEEAVEADRVIMMSEGRIAQEAPPDRFFSAADHIAGYDLGTPVTVQLANALRGRGVPIPGDAIRPDGLLHALTRWKPADKPASPDIPISPVNGRDVFVDVRQLEHTYQPGTVLASPALNGVDLRIAAGERVAIVGPNGSGKSTLMQHFNRLLAPTAGVVKIEGKDLAAPGLDLRSFRRRIGAVFQFPEAQLFEETVFDDVAFGPKNAGLPENEIRKRVMDALEAVRLDPDAYGERTPFSLSGGERRRVAIAGILAMRPALLALDEPTAGLDFQGVGLIEAMLDAFHASGGTTALISHDMDLVARQADRVVVMDRGRVVADGSAAAILSDAALLTRLGLRRPGLVEILSAIRAMGYPVRTALFDVEAAAEEIVRGLDQGIEN